MPRPATGQTFVARVRVKLTKWKRFEYAAQAQGTDRSKVLNDFIDWYLRERGAVMPERPTRAAVDQVQAEREAAEHDDEADAS
jgi:hypothetical protein